MQNWKYLIDFIRELDFIFMLRACPEQKTKKKSICDPKFSFRQKFRSLTKSSMFYKNIDLWLQILFRTNIFDKIFDFWETFRFLRQISTFWETFRFLTKISIFWEKFRFLRKNSIFDKIFDFWQENLLFGQNWEPKLVWPNS